ncbi:cell division cycle protein 48 [Nitzschia inconspicua]|uniref:Cell division cycle protein 48 n=1 Tax=Nitzschia inconspicua TaxID=303405 RepID=A0A9K3K3P4_9STRA|nr:cell division cycle protein 48 [Nitzschia inconspicua]KAG7369787.1 cell division cycle protein 48 [Nitzschia inconspicua]
MRFASSSSAVLAVAVASWDHVHASFSTFSRTTGIASHNDGHNIMAKSLTSTPTLARKTNGWFAATDLRGGSMAVEEEEETQPVNKKSKKKKKKKSSSSASKSTNSNGSSTKAKSSSPSSNTDLSMAILGSSNDRNSMQVFKYSSEEGHSVVGMAEAAMMEMGLFEGDTVSIKGKRGKKTLGSVAALSEIDITALSDGGTETSAIGMSSDAMKNVGVRAGDKVTITPAPNVKFGKAVLILPTANSLKLAGINDQDDIKIFDDYLAPYFANNFRPLYRGDTFKINGPKGELEFQAVEIDSVEEDGDTSCIVVEETIIECEGDPVEEMPDDLENAGYDQIGGASKHLAAVRELVELPLKHAELWRKLGINPPRGVLLTGPPGCGKTAMARAVAAETGAYFFVINGPEVISKRAGESETNLRRAFEDAEQNAEDYNGAIIFIDEIDSIAPKRENAGGEVEKRIVSQLLTLMDGLKPTSRVVVMAATNRPSVIEPALRRPGRFDRELDMGIPDEQGRLEILQIKTRDMRLGKDVDLEFLARGTHGYVGADIQQLCMEAALECIRSKMGLIDFDKDQVDKKILDSIVVEGKHFDYALGIVAPSSLRENQVEVPDVHWEDVGGLEDVKRELHETVQYPVEHAEKFIKFGMSPSKGVLFYGPPGCGKTLLAKAIANEAGANFISIKGPELLTQWFGESEANVRELFDKARAASPCILMFDEMDSIAKTRGSGGGGSSEAGDRVINQILTEIDGVGARKNVFVIGATNRPDILDPAVIRPGRLDQLIYIPLPDLKSRMAIFKAQLRKAPVDPEIDIEVLARSTHGFSGADIAEICTTASKLAIREAILDAEERAKKAEAASDEDDGEQADSSKSSGEATKAVGEKMLITKRHFNFAMSRARRSVSEKDLALFEEFAEKQKAGRGEAANNFKFGEGSSVDGEDALADEDLYS